MASIGQDFVRRHTSHSMHEDLKINLLETMLV